MQTTDAFLCFLFLVLQRSWQLKQGAVSAWDFLFNICKLQGAYCSTFKLCCTLNLLTPSQHTTSHLVHAALLQPSNMATTICGSGLKQKARMTRACTWT